MSVGPGMMDTDSRLGFHFVCWKVRGMVSVCV